ncbi:tetratricopeptide repeat protein [Streptomyces halstedii]|uniref:Tetratricopeptide repeat protein n=1 Tax=Streptomyces halstedii TaxID=1944 RepID=A0A6N9TWA8_STRHA|nr:tetratricopeptide repeat protein [Streptomyces halstedii]NEA14153.1 tetratricopeptide repeat protein [Streptomyces halstedii]
MAEQSRLSRQEIIRRRQRDGFVGRRREMARFMESCRQAPESDAFEFFFHVHGNAGVGKSTLARQWETMAREHAAAVTTFVDDDIHDAVEAMEAISIQLARQGCVLKRFDKLLMTYRQRRHQADAALDDLGPEAEADIGGAVGSQTASVSSRVATLIGLAGLGMLPGVGALTAVIDPQQVAQGADRVRAQLSARLGSHADVHLVMKPVEALTPVFLEEIGDIAQRRPRLVLFFDVYERTGAVLDSWLHDIVFSEDFGTLPVNVQIVLSGQGRLNAGVWGNWLGQVSEVLLEEFTEEESRALVAAKGITDSQVVDVVLGLSGGLPLLVDMLSSIGPAAQKTLGDPSDTAVERFLRWESDPRRREAALRCAFPLQLNEDIYRAAVSEASADDYPWLRGLAFLSSHAGRCRYHRTVRSSMLRLQRGLSPIGWMEQHTRLADSFGRWRGSAESTLACESDLYWRDAVWREHRLNESYHRLCAMPRTVVAEVLGQIVHAADQGVATLHRWAQMLTQAGHDSEDDGLLAWGRRLEAAGAQSDGALVALSILVSAPELGAPSRALAHAVRGRYYRVAGLYEQALVEFETAQVLAPSLVRGLYGRGRTYQSMGRYDDALTDLNHAIGLSPGLSGAVATRGETYRRMGRFVDALADFTKAMDEDPQAWIVGSRGLTYRQMGRYPEALADFTRAVNADPQHDRLVASRGLTYLLMGRWNDALNDLTRAITINPDNSWAVNCRGLVHQLTDRRDEALTDHTRAIALRSDYGTALVCRSSMYQLMGRYDEALADLHQAIATDPQYETAFTERGRVYQRMGRHEEALADFAQAIAINPDEATPHYLRSIVLRQLGREEDGAHRHRVIRALTEEAAREGRDSPKAHAKLFLVFCARAEWESATSQLNTALNDAPYPLLLAKVTLVELEHLQHVLPAVAERITPFQEQLRHMLTQRMPGS